MSSSAAPSSSTSFKVFFGDEIRRVSLASSSPSFNDLKTVLRSIFGARFHDELPIQYIDEDNDHITVASELEWTEALRFMSNAAVKRLYVTASKRPLFKNAAPAQPLFFYESSDKNAKFDAASSSRKGPAVSSCVSSCSSSCKEESHGQNQGKNEQQPQQPQQGRAFAKLHGLHQPSFRHWGQRRCQRQQKQQSGAALEELKRAVPCCLERLFDGGKILPHHIPEWLASAVRVNVVNEASQGQEEVVDLDVDIDRLKCLLHRRGLERLEAKAYGEATNVFEALLLLDRSSPLALYNLACAEALEGKSEAACRHLAESVANGYSNLGHLLRDSDLDSLRLLPAYLAVVDSLRAANKTFSLPISVASAPAPAPEPAQAPIQEPEQEQEEKESESESSQEQEQEQKPEPKPEEQEKEKEERFKNELKLLSDMGFADVERNRVLLTAENGDLASVINQLFNLAL